MDEPEQIENEQLGNEDEDEDGEGFQDYDPEEDN
jgi:hypothetical protein